jgi:hypothetical protein
MQESQIFSKTVSLPTGATGLSAVISFNGSFALLGFIVPSTWVTADLWPQASVDPPTGHPDDPTPTNFYPVYDETGQAVIFKVGNISSTARMVCISQAVYVTFTHLKLKSVDTSTPATAVDQTASPTITVIYKAV